MTSTSTFQGMDTSSKPSSRVLAPPGGGSSNIFGTSDTAQAPQKKEVPVPKPAEKEPAPAPQSNQGDRSIRQAPKQAYNPITGAPYDLPEQKKKTTEEEEEKDGKENEKKPATVTVTAAKPAAEVKPSTRVAQPPGGKSSGLW